MKFACALLALICACTVAVLNAERAQGANKFLDKCEVAVAPFTKDACEKQYYKALKHWDRVIGVGAYHTGGSKDVSMRVALWWVELLQRVATAEKGSPLTKGEQKAKLKIAFDSKRESSKPEASGAFDFDTVATSFLDYMTFLREKATLLHLNKQILNVIDGDMWADGKVNWLLVRVAVNCGASSANKPSYCELFTPKSLGVVEARFKALQTACTDFQKFTKAEYPEEDNAFKAADAFASPFTQGKAEACVKGLDAFKKAHGSDFTTLPPAPGHKYRDWAAKIAKEDKNTMYDPILMISQTFVAPSHDPSGDTTAEMVYNARHVATAGYYRHNPKAVTDLFNGNKAEYLKQQGSINPKVAKMVEDFVQVGHEVAYMKQTTATASECVLCGSRVWSVVDQMEAPQSPPEALDFELKKTHPKSWYAFTKEHGILNMAGPSGTTILLLGLGFYAGLSPDAAPMMRLSAMATMLPFHHHSREEILIGGAAMVKEWDAPSLSFDMTKPLTIPGGIVADEVTINKLPGVDIPEKVIRPPYNHLATISWSKGLEALDQVVSKQWSKTDQDVPFLLADGLKFPTGIQVFPNGDPGAAFRQASRSRKALEKWKEKTLVPQSTSSTPTTTTG